MVFNYGVLECWSIGVLLKKVTNPLSNTPTLQYSKTPKLVEIERFLGALSSIVLLNLVTECVSSLYKTIFQCYFLITFAEEVFIDFNSEKPAGSRKWTI
jgi:hypothetical protein